MSVLMPSRSRSSFIHYATLVRSPARVQGGAVNVPLPALNVTMPVGVVGVAEVSVTVAVHVVLWPDAIVDGVQLTMVLVLVGLIFAAPELLVWAESPPYDPLMV